MDFSFEDRASTSPFVERIWRCFSEGGGPFISVAASHNMFVVTKLQGKVTIEYRGPETKTTRAICPPNGEWLGIQLKYGVYMPKLPTPEFVNGEICFPSAGSNAYWLGSSVWQYPNYENADAFVDRLIRQEHLVHDEVVRQSQNGLSPHLSARSQQRRFVYTTGMSRKHATIIQRARIAAHLLSRGSHVQDVVAQSGYADQAHLIRSLRRFTGQTPGQLIGQSTRMSFLFNTESPS